MTVPSLFGYYALQLTEYACRSRFCRFSSPTSIYATPFPLSGDVRLRPLGRSCPCCIRDFFRLPHCRRCLVRGSRGDIVVSTCGTGARFRNSRGPFPHGAGTRDRKGYPSASQTMKKGFTVIELLVVIAILAVVAVVVILVLNPAALLQGARDGNRLSDLATLDSAVGLFSADGGSLGLANTLYVSIPDPSATSTAGDQCQGLGLPSLPTGWNYQCAATSSYRKTYGTGWMPLNFSTASFGTPLSILPIDPTNKTSSAFYYTYVRTGRSMKLLPRSRARNIRLSTDQARWFPVFPRWPGTGATSP